MKSVVRIVTLVAVAAALAPSVLASTIPIPLPDGGSSAVMVGLALVGMAALRKRSR